MMTVTQTITTITRISMYPAVTIRISAQATMTWMCCSMLIGISPIICYFAFMISPAIGQYRRVEQMNRQK